MNNIGCLHGCGRVAVVRGCCNKCWQSCRRLIEAGKTTDSQLVAAGKMGPAKKSPFNAFKKKS